MDQSLDLSVTFMAPPASASPETIAGIELRCDQLGLLHQGDLLTDPLTTRERENLHWYLEEYAEWPYEQFLERGKKVEAFLSKLGKRLYQAVCGSAGAMSIVQAWRLQPLQPRVQRQISIISELPRTLNLPWELLHDEQGFLMLRTRNPVSLIRRLPQRELSTFPISFEPPLRIILVTSRPDNTSFIDPRSIARELLDEVQPQIDDGTIAVEFLRPPTLRALRERLSDTNRPLIHILHFDGHGTFGKETDKQGQQYPSVRKQGMLAFEDDEGKLDLVEGERLAQVMQDSGVKLAVLTACQSAVSGPDDAFSSVAAQLIQSGLDAVSAMGASVLTASATRYAEAFYRSLLSSRSVPLAQDRARQVLHDDPRRNVHHRQKNDEGTMVQLRDWWVPHYYQQRPLLLQRQSTRKHTQKLTHPPSQRLSEEMYPQPRYGFSGRTHELLQIERNLLQGKVVVLHGFGGIGKTALAYEIADWLIRTKMYEGACFISFEHGGDGATLLSALGTYLGIYDRSYTPNDTKAALAQLVPTLKDRHILVIADNLESILPNGEAPLDKAARTQLWDIFLALANCNAGVLLTSRDTTFCDGRLAPGTKVKYLPLHGLHPDDAYALASRLLADLGIDRAQAPYAGLRDLLYQLDYHPLAIQLVLPVLHERSLTTIRAEFSALLPRFEDDTETGRNRSLLASLDYSLRRLNEEQRTLLPHLAPFEGGASEDNLLVITAIPEGEWAKLRLALEQAALLTVEQVHETVAVPFLRFHPVLVPYLRSQFDADDGALRKRYTRQYLALANYLRREDIRRPQPVRALVRRELPNMRRALEQLLKIGELDAASEIADRIAGFLTIFGLTRERSELRQSVAKMRASENTQRGETLTKMEWLSESGMGEEELAKGGIRAAHTRFTQLLARIEIVPEGISLGSGSYEHCSTLRWLSYCLHSYGRHADAETCLCKARAMMESLIEQQPDNQDFFRGKGVLLSDLGNMLFLQGKYDEAQGMYEEAMELKQHLGDLRGKAVTLGQLGSLAERQQDYSKARIHHTNALHLFHELNEPTMEGVAWHQLGKVALEQKVWDEAEHCFRESLKIDELLGDMANAAQTMNQLAIVDVFAGRPSEAEGWLKRAIELDEQIHPNSPLHAQHLNNLASLLIKEVTGGSLPETRQSEAYHYAEQALKMQEELDTSSKIWLTLHNLAQIAEMRGQIELAGDYRRRERETFAAFTGNRFHVNRQHSLLISDIALAARGDAQMRERVETVLPQLETTGWHITAATQRIWNGQRDWHSLVEGIDRDSALLILLVLETL